jgi:hypothetical protein
MVDAGTAMRKPPTITSTTLERAFQLAGRSRGMADLRQRLRLEGYHNTERDLFGSDLREQLQTLMLKSRPS